MIKPTVGRVVLVRINGNTGCPQICQASDGEALPALVARVWNDRQINVGGFDANGAPFGFTSLQLLQDGDETPALGMSFAEWMPYQKGQAAKTEKAEAALADAKQPAPAVTEEMVSRFLAWPLPQDFTPDCGISFDGRKDDDLNKSKGWPVGTNLLTATQARTMLEHVMQASPPEAIDANVAPGCSLFSDPRKLAPARLPSHFQIGDMAQIQREGEPKQAPQAIKGVQFTEGKVHYLVDGEVVDSADVTAQPR